MKKTRRLEISAGRITWEVHLQGDQPQWLFAFHGFNRGFDDWSALATKVSSKYSLAAVSLFHHGSIFTGANDVDAFTPEELRTAFNQLVGTITREQYGVIGHSFGGRLALNMVEYGPPGLKELYLMAPDALRYHPGYRFITGTSFGRYLMGNFRNDPKRIISLIRFFAKLGVYKPRTADYFIHQITHEKSRELVYKCWMSHRKTIPHLGKIVQLLKASKIKTTLIFGAKDTVIPVSQGSRFAKRTYGVSSLHVLDTGHRIYEKTDAISGIIMSENQ
jgi:pimeloyl-ACP methyl ester carboxylesterase